MTETVIGQPNAELIADEEALARARLVVRKLYLRLRQHQAEARLMDINEEALELDELQYNFSVLNDLVARGDAAYQESIRFRRMADKIEEELGR